MYNMDDARPSRAPVFIWAFLTLADTDYDCVRKLCDGRREGRSSLGWTRVTTPGPPGERKNWQKLRLMNIPGIKPESPHSSHGTDTANIFSPMCLVTGRGAHTEREQRIYWELQILGEMMRMMTRPGQRTQTLSSLSQPGPGTEFQMSSTTATRIYWHFWVSFTFHITKYVGRKLRA